MFFVLTIPSRVLYSLNYMMKKYDFYKYPVKKHVSICGL